MTNNQKTPFKHAEGKVVKAFGNLLHVAFTGDIRQGEVAFVEVQGVTLKAEVLEISDHIAKLQVFEDTRGVGLDTKVNFTGKLLEAELGPGLLSTIIDGLQNPLTEIAKSEGYFLPRGLYLAPLDREKKWNYIPKAELGKKVSRGDSLGETLEGKFHHQIMLPFSHYGTYTITWVITAGAYTIDTVVAKALDTFGHEHSFTMVQKWPIKSTLCCGDKIKPYKMMDTGNRIIDTQFPLVKGGSFCTPGPFGAGKTVLQHHLSKFSAVDIVIVTACGERAGEVVEILQEFPHLIDPHTGNTLMERTVIICNTSSMPVAAREASVYLGVTIAEYYRQMGLDVLVLADSTSRWAQAMREMSSRLEEIPGEEAFPAYLSSRIANFYERSGVLRLKNGKEGSLTIGGAVSPAGGNFEEPVTQSTLSVVGAFLGLSRERSDSRRYPAIDPLISWSKYVQDTSKEIGIKVERWGDYVKRAHLLLIKGNEIGKRMEVVGEEGISLSDMILYLKAELYDFSYLQQNSFDKEDTYCPVEKQIPLFLLINKIFDKTFDFSTHDEARKYFLHLQNQIKNICFMSIKTDAFHIALNTIDELVR